MKIAVAGTGYVGMPIATLLAQHNEVTGVDYVFHAAALKQVPSCEFFPMEAVKTNVIGTDNTRRLNLEKIKAKIASLEYIQNELNGVMNVVK